MMNVHVVLFVFPDEISDVYNVTPPHFMLLDFVVLQPPLRSVYYVPGTTYMIKNISYHDRSTNLYAL